MTDIYTLVKKDTAPQIQAYLTRENDGSAISFLNGTCKLKFRKKDTTNILFELVALNEGSNYADGVAIFTFSGTQLHHNEGYYEGEIEITQQSGKIETVYKILEFYLRNDF